MCWLFSKLKKKRTPNSNVGKATSIQQFLEERLPIKKFHNKTQLTGVETHRRGILFQDDAETGFFFCGKTCFLIVEDLIGHAQFRLGFNVWRSKFSNGTCIDYLK